jgi:Fur family ferric uptake transcriptional regulator
MPIEMAEVEKKFLEGLRKAQLHRTQQRTLLLRTFLAVKNPITYYDLLTAAKQYDMSISYHTVMRTMEVLVECGLANRLAGGGKTTPARFQPVDAECKHHHLVCKDCGAVIEHAHDDRERSPASSLPAPVTA